MSVPVHLSKLSDVVKNDVAKKIVYDQLVAKVNNVDTSDFVLKTKYDTDKLELENKIPDTSGLVKKTDYNAKIAEIEGMIPNVSNLTTKIASTTVQNKIPSVSNLVKKRDYDTKITEIENNLNNHNHDKYIATSEFNNLAADVFNARLAKANLVTKIHFDNRASNLDQKVTTNEHELKRLKRNRVFIFLGNLLFDGGDGSQAYLIFQPVQDMLHLLSILNTYLNGNLKDCLMKVLNLLLHLITVLIH